MSEASLWYLKNMMLFKDFSDEKIKRISEMTDMCDYSDGERIPVRRHQNEIGIVKKGQIKLIRSDEDGNRITRALLGRGELLGSLTDQGPELTHRAETVEDSLICWAKREDMVEILEDSPQISMRVSQQLQKQLERIDFRLENLLFKDARERVEFVLGQLADANQEKQQGPYVRLNLSHQDLADLTGLTRSTVTRNLNRLQKQDRLELSRGSITIKQPTHFQPVA